MERESMNKIIRKWNNVKWKRMGEVAEERRKPSGVNLRRLEVFFF